MSSKHLLTIGLSWQQVESQMSKNYISNTQYVDTKSLPKVSFSLVQTVLMQHKTKPIGGHCVPRTELDKGLKGSFADLP